MAILIVVVVVVIGGGGGGGSGDDWSLVFSASNWWQSLRLRRIVRRTL